MNGFRLGAYGRLAAFRSAWMLAAAFAGCFETARAQDKAPPNAATVDEAAAVLNLEAFPLYGGAKTGADRRMASLFYEAKGDVKSAFAFCQKELAVRGWKPIGEPYVADTFASGTFGKDGFAASVSASPSEPGSVLISVVQHGNVSMANLPAPPDAKLLYGDAINAIKVTPMKRDDAAALCRKLLIADGWEPYGTAGDSLIFKKNAVRLNAMISTAPAQEGKTSIQYSGDLMSADLPAVPDAIRAHYADSTKSLEFDVKGPPENLIAFYRERLSKSGWKPTTEQSIKTNEHQMMIFRNAKRDMLTLEFYPQDEFLRGTLEHRSAAEVDELDRLAKAEADKKKANAIDRPHPESKPTVALALPADAKNIAEDDGDLEFTVKSGTGKSTVEALRKALVDAGWTEDNATLETSAGVVALSKKDSGSLTIHYTDIAGMPAEIGVTGFGVVVKQVKAAAK